MKNSDNHTKQTVGTEIIKIDASSLGAKIYEIRGEKVMLDFDLAEIYGYTTSAFNRQVKNNIEKFDDDFMFQLTPDELALCLRSQNVTLNSAGNRRGEHFKYLPYAFTEQGIYMLMTVLHGELAIKQSKALIRTFRAMKDYIVENHSMIDYKSNLQLAMELSKNATAIDTVKTEVNKIDEQIQDLNAKMNDVVLKSELSPILLDFSKATRRQEFLLLEGELAKADEALIDIYAQAEHSIIIVDNYIDIKTLRHLQKVQPDIAVTIFSDNLGRYLSAEDYRDFRKEFPDIKIDFRQNGKHIHDRFIILDFDTERERVFHCGASMKDAGSKLTPTQTLAYFPAYDKILLER